jgi:hypothetical protein
MKSFWAISSINVKFVSDISKTLSVSRGSLFKEAIEIWLHPSNFNTDIQLSLSHSWNPATSITDRLMAELRKKLVWKDQWQATWILMTSQQSALGQDIADSTHCSPHPGCVTESSFVYKYSVNTIFITSIPNDRDSESPWHIGHQLHINMADHLRWLYYILPLQKLQI